MAIATSFAPVVFLRDMWRIPLSDLNYNDAEKAAVLQVLESRWLTMGPRTEEFEAAMAAMLDARHAIAVANCTCALELAYAYLALTTPPKRKIVLLPDITFVATANATIAAGLEPLLLDGAGARIPWAGVSEVARILSEKADEIAAVTVMHYAGYDAHTEAIAQLCDEHRIILIEDVAHAPGATTATGRALGTIGHTGCFSFFSNKNLATGEGGMLVTNDDDAATWYRHARSHGMTASTWARHAGRTAGYDVIKPGRNFRCTEITAALGLAQLAKLEAGNQRRREIVARYRAAFEPAGLSWLDISEPSASVGAAHIMPLMCRDEAQREGIRGALAAAGIQTSHHYPPIHTLSWFAQRPGLHSGPLSYATAFAARQLTLPLYPTMPDSALDEIISSVLAAADA